MTDAATQALKLQTVSVMRACEGALQTAALASQPPEAARMQEALNLGAATLARYQAMQSNWLAAWADWAAYAGALDGADTVPKFTERLGNIGLRAQAQLAAQANDLANLNENVAVSYAYWVAQQLDAD